MATTAQILLTSDLLSDSMSITTDTICMKAGTTSENLDQMEMGYIELVPDATGSNLFNADNSLNVNKANKVYVCNESTDETYYITIMIDAQAIGRLYAGDWMFIPWAAEDATGFCRYK